MNFSPALPRQEYSLVQSHTNMNLTAFNIEPSAGSLHPSFLLLSPVIPLGNRQGGNQVLRGLIKPRHRLGTILLAKRERILICHPEESFEAEQVICEMQGSPGTMLGKRKVYKSTGLDVEI